MSLSVLPNVLDDNYFVSMSTSSHPCTKGPSRKLLADCTQVCSLPRNCDQKRTCQSFEVLCEFSKIKMALYTTSCNFASCDGFAWNWCVTSWALVFCLQRSSWQTLLCMFIWMKLSDASLVRDIFSMTGQAHSGSFNVVNWCDLRCVLARWAVSISCYSETVISRM